MSHPSPSPRIAPDAQDRFKAFNGAGKQSFQNPTLEPKQQRSFWSVLAKRAKSAFLDDDNPPCTTSDSELGQKQDIEPTRQQYTHPKPSSESRQRRADAPVLQKGFEAITSSLSIIGGTIGNALEEGFNIVETKATDFLSSDSRIFSTKKKVDSAKSTQELDLNILEDSAADKETQLKASRDQVAMAMAAKVKLLLRELKQVKADLAFAKERCMQLEEENRRIRDSLIDGLKPYEEDLMRIQLETLLAEKARLAQENAYYARENYFLREVVNYHQSTMQDAVSLDESCAEAEEMAYDLTTEDAEEHPPEVVISTVAG